MRANASAISPNSSSKILENFLEKMGRYKGIEMVLKFCFSYLMGTAKSRRQSEHLAPSFEIETNRM